MSQQGTHIEHEDMPWTISIGNHPARTESPTYVRSRKLMIKVLATQRNFVYGCGLVDDPAGIGSPKDSPREG